MLPARTPTDPMFVNAALDLMEMVKNAQVNLIFFAVIFRIPIYNVHLTLCRSV